MAVRPEQASAGTTRRAVAVEEEASGEYGTVAYAEPPVADVQFGTMSECWDQPFSSSS